MQNIRERLAEDKSALYEGLKDCPDCDGKGRRRIMKNCGIPASYCCGGCQESIECETCEGYGMVEDEELEEADP